MFQFKKTGSETKDPGESKAIPNNFGRVRTFKKDLENFGKGMSAEEIPDIKNIPFQEEKKPEHESPPKQQESPQAAPPVSEKETSLKNPFQSIPTPPPFSSTAPKPSPPKASTSQSFFSEKPSPASPDQNILPERRKEGLPAQRPKRKFVLPIIILFLVVIAGAGFYYYWFFILNNSPAAPSENSSAPESQTQSTPSQSPSTDTAEPQNKNLQRLVVDTSQNPTAIKDAIQKFAMEFSTSASENDLVEIKLVDSNNQPISKKDFFTGSEATVSDPILMKLSEDYSLFAKKERGATKMGLVFKIVTSSGLADEMKSWEPTIAKDLNFLYIGQSLSAFGPFSSSQYKNADIRYFNFSSPANTSFDYSIISNFLVIGTSKETERSILDYMSKQ